MYTYVCTGFRLSNPSRSNHYLDTICIYYTTHTQAHTNKATCIIFSSSLLVHRTKLPSSKCKVVIDLCVAFEGRVFSLFGSFFFTETDYTGRYICIHFLKYRVNWLIELQLIKRTSNDGVFQSLNYVQG